MPLNPLYGRCPPNGAQWNNEIEEASTDIPLVGHTHVPFIRRIGEKLLLNPGSIGQPRGGASVSSYAAWLNGELELRTFRYPVEATVKRLKALPLPQPVKLELIHILQAGSV
jgi:protein phosphatase